MNPLVPLAIIGGGLVALAKLLRDQKNSPAPTVAFDCSRELDAYYNDYVRLSQQRQATLRGHRDANRARLRDALLNRGWPTPTFFSQGSYAMDTINQEPNGAYDIDDGVVFPASELIGPRGGQLSSLQARQLLAECADDPRLGAAPKLRTNCVRIHYAAGYHVDLAVYRAISDRDGNERLEHGGASWKHSDPRGVTQWFQEAVQSKSPDVQNGRQMRRVVRLVKHIASSRVSWNLPSGFILSVLVNEVYEPVDGRDDVALYICLAKIYQRLKSDLEVKHPVIDTKITRGRRDASMVALEKRLKVVLETLGALVEPSCDFERACSAWRQVFNDNRFGG
jgi:hypothetical protein